MMISLFLASFMGLGLIFFALYYPRTELYHSNPTPALFIYILGLTLLGNSTFLFLRLSSALIQGWRNETRLLRLLRSLPDAYTGFTNLSLPGPAPLRLDIVLVGPKGLLFFVVKHYSGKIIYDGQEWIRIRPNRRRQKLRDLSAQLKAAEKAFTQILKERNLTAPVTGLLLFAHPRLTLEVSKASVPVARPDTLLQAISSRPDRLPERSLQPIVEALQQIGA